LGISPPDWLAYGQFPIIAVLSIHYMPFVILLFGNALKRFDSQLEESARVLGASRATITRKIVLPMMLPSLFSAITLIFAKCLGDFGVAYILGLPVKYEVLATSLYRAVVSRSPGVAAVLAGVVILLGLISVLIELRMVREANKFVTVGGKSTMDRVSTLGRKQILATGFASFIFLLTVVIPLGVLILTTIMKVPGRFVPSNFTLDYWIGRDLPTVAVPNGILLTPEFWSATWNSIWMVGLAAVVAGILGQLVGYVVVRGPKVLGTPLRFITFLPYLVPGIAFAAAFLSAFAVARGPIPALYGTGILLVIALTADQMPFASRAGISSMMQLGKDPEEAAQIAGAGWMKRLAKIVFPIQRQALVSGILMPFISGLKGLSLVVLLAVPGTDLLTTYSIRLVDYGMVQASNAVVLMICLIALVGTLVGQRVGKTSLSSGM
ncbi:MAG: ABC transporter permease, partial [Canibacter sp.]